MKTEEVQRESEINQPDSCVQPVWMVPPVQPVPSFNIHKPVLYMFNGVPMAFALGVTHG